MIDKIMLKNFRCFREAQTARLAPLTLLVGENSTGKTSFMAMIRALWDLAYQHQIPNAIAPVRSKPKRTYDPARPSPDPEGDYIPMYLAYIHFHYKERWEKLKGSLDQFGVDSDLFDEITIKRLGKRESDPFQIQVRKFGNKRSLKGPMRNLIDVGYGVSQVLPVITELLRETTVPSMLLLLQPEVHLHPRAQAALGSLFCQKAGPNRQLIVETHGDHLLSRIRMDVRDKKTKLKPDDVSILFFERNELDVSTHSIRLDEEGSVKDAPDSYRNFFKKEMARSLRYDDVRH